MSKPAFCICEFKGADTLQISNFGFAKSTAQSLYFPKPLSIFILVQPGLCQTWSETLKIGVLKTWLNYFFHITENYLFETKISKVELSISLD